jgi:hypothetical protein
MKIQMLADAVAVAARGRRLDAVSDGKTSCQMLRTPAAANL